MSYNASARIYYVKARLKWVLRAGRRMQRLLRPEWILADYSMQLDRRDWMFVLKKSLQPLHSVHFTASNKLLYYPLLSINFGTKKI